MERLRKQQLLEQSIYGAIWIVIFLLPLIGGYFAVSGGLEKEEIRVIVYDSWLSILPFFVLFLLNNYGLVPYFLFKKKYWYYIISLVFLISTACWVIPDPSMERFPKEFRYGDLRKGEGKIQRDQIIKMREKARQSLFIGKRLGQTIRLWKKCNDRAASLNRPFIPFLPSPSVTLFIV